MIAVCSAAPRSSRLKAVPDQGSTRVLSGRGARAGAGHDKSRPATSARTSPRDRSSRPRARSSTSPAPVLRRTRVPHCKTKPALAASQLWLPSEQLSERADVWRGNADRRGGQNEPVAICEMRDHRRARLFIELPNFTWSLTSAFRPCLTARSGMRPLQDTWTPR
jgi:hypothetical protein